MSVGAIPKPTIEAWQAQELRASFFTTLDAVPLRRSGWWQLATGGAPERIEDRPQVPLHVEEGPFGGGVLTLNVQADRVDWILAPQVDSIDGFEDGPTVDRFAAARDEFLGLISGWVPSAPDCRRLAFGARVLLRVPSREAGYHLLAAYLPFAPDPESSTDLRYQINRQRKSRVDAGLLINRLQSWSVLSSRKSAVSVAGRLRVPEVVLHEKWSIMLEADVNTDAEAWDRIVRERTGVLIQELADLATQLVLEGDRPGQGDPPAARSNAGTVDETVEATPAETLMPPIDMLLKLARQSPPPQSWFEEDFSDL